MYPNLKPSPLNATKLAQGARESRARKRRIAALDLRGRAEKERSGSERRCMAVAAREESERRRLRGLVEP